MPEQCFTNFIQISAQLLVTLLFTFLTTSFYLKSTYLLTHNITHKMVIYSSFWRFSYKKTSEGFFIVSLSCWYKSLNMLMHMDADREWILNYWIILKMAEQQQQQSIMGSRRAILLCVRCKLAHGGRHIGAHKNTCTW